MHPRIDRDTCTDALSRTSPDLSIIVIEDSAGDGLLLIDALAAGGLGPGAIRVANRTQLQALLGRARSVDAFVSNYRLRDLADMGRLGVNTGTDAVVPLVVTGRRLTSRQVAAVREHRATEFVDMRDLERLPHAVTQGIHHYQAECRTQMLGRAYTELIERIPIAVFQARGDGQIQIANAAAAAIFGFMDTEAFIASSAVSLYANPNDRTELMKRLGKDGQVIDDECLMRRVDGTTFWFSRTVKAIPQAGDPTGLWETVGRDTTATRRAADELLESEAYLRAVLATAPDALIGTDRTGTVTEWNAAAEKTFGRARSDAIGHSISDVIMGPRFRDLHEEFVLRPRLNPSSPPAAHTWGVFQASRANGQLFPVELGISGPIALGQTDRFVIFARDISERRQSAIALATSEESLSNLLASAPVALATFDLNGRFTLVAGNLFHDLGFDLDGLAGMGLTDVFPERPDLLALFREAQDHDVETDLTFGDRTLQIRLGPYQPVGSGTSGVRAVAFDNTATVGSVAALHQSEEVFRTLFEQAAIGIAIYEVPRAEVPGQTRMNARMRQLLDMEEDPDEAWWASAMSRDKLHETTGLYGNLMAGDDPYVQERRRRIRSDGTSIWIDLRTVLVRDADDVPVRFQIVAIDVTNQVASERRLRRQADRQAALLDLSRAGLEGLPTPDFLAKAVEILARGAGSAAASVLRLEPAQDRLVRVASDGVDPELPSEYAVTPAEIQRMNESFDQARVVEYHSNPARPPLPWLVPPGIRASLVAVLDGVGPPFGVATVNRASEPDFDIDDVQFMQLASPIISVAVQRKADETQRRLLLGHVVEAQDAERQAIARDIHDDAVQVMTAANLRLELLRMALKDPTQIDAAEKLQVAVSLAIARLRNLLFELVPPDLESHGIAAAVTSHLAQCETDTGITWDLQVSALNEPPKAVSIVLCRIFQEALTNIRKHAKATAVTVSLTTVDSGVLMSVSDDGNGLAQSLPVASPGHFGLASMRERAEISGGWCRISGEPGHGTVLSAWIPVPGHALPSPIAQAASGATRA